MVHLMWLFYGYGLCVPMKSTRPWGVPFGCNLWFIREPLFTPLMHPWCALLWSQHAIVHVTLHHSVRNQQGQRMPFGIGPKLSEVKWSQIVSVVLNRHKLNNIFLRCPFEFHFRFHFRQIWEHRQLLPNSAQLYQRPGNWRKCAFRFDRVHRFVLTEIDNSLASLSATATGLSTLMGNSWLNITKIFISNLFAVLDNTAEWIKESVSHHGAVAVANIGSVTFAINVLSTFGTGKQESTVQTYSESNGHFTVEEF